MSQFFYSDQIFNDTILLSEDEANHALKVLRKHQGDCLIVVDGIGGYYRAVLDNENIKDCRLQILDKKENYNKPNQYIHIAIAPTKSHDRIEWFIEKSVEIGIQEISFIFSHYSERNNVKWNRIKKRAISSMKQSLKAYIPKINDVVSFQTFIENCKNKEKYIGYLGDNNREALSSVATSGSDYCILIGPEGDFMPSEIDFALQHEFKTISLGGSRLRTETAGIAACHILNIINE